MQRTVVIGDLHGCYEEALDLFERVGIGAADRVIFAGDLVDRGPNPRQCVELAMQHECILGNHEDKHLSQRHRPALQLLPAHARTRAELGEEHLDYFARLPTMILMPEHNAVVAHAGAYPSVPLDRQDPYHLLHIQCIRSGERKSHWPSKAPSDSAFWACSWRGPERVIFGHTVIDSAYVGEWAVGIDTGCVYGGALTAVILPEWRIVSVPSRQPKTRASHIAQFEILPGIRCYS